MNRLKDKTALITGASAGIGEACAHLLAKEGVNLVLMARREKKLLELQEQLLQKTNHKVNIMVVPGDVRNKEEVFKKIGAILEQTHIDILINSAGLALGLEKIDNADVTDWEIMIDTNIKGLLYVTKMIVSHMRQRNCGHIINLGSIAGEYGYPGGNVYCATKAAVKMLNDVLNIDVLGTAIRVSNISPGAVNTEFSQVRFKGDQDRAQSVYKGFKPLYALDIAELIVFILNTPEHVNIQQTIVMSTSQRNPYLLHRE